MIEKYILVFFISMVPLIELRGAIPIAVGMGVTPSMAIRICALGNMLPVPVIYLFARKFLLWGLDKPVVGPVCRFFRDKGAAAGARLQRSEFGRFGLIVALIFFVGIPIPGTGAWTGTLGASFLNMDIRETLFAVAAGIIIAALIMTAVSMLGVHIFGL